MISFTRFIERYNKGVLLTKEEEKQKTEDRVTERIVFVIKLIVNTFMRPLGSKEFL